MSTQLDFTFAMPTMASQKKASIKFIRGVIGGLRAPTAPKSRIPPALRCRGPPPSTLSGQFSRNLDRVLNLDLPDEGFSVIHDDEISPIDYAEDYQVEDDVNTPSRLSKHGSSMCSIQSDDTANFPSSGRTFSAVRPTASQGDSSGWIISKRFHTIQVATSGPGPVTREAGQGKAGGIRPGKASRATPHGHSTALDDNQVLCVDRKRPLFQPPPLGGEVSNDEDDEDDEGDSDDWSIINSESDDDDLSCSCEKPVSRCQKTEATTVHPANERHDSCPRIHPLCAAKYGRFFES